MKQFLVLWLVLNWVNSQAVEFNVTTTDDTVDVSLADGLCLDSNGECSLRAAIMQTNILGSDDVIYLPRGTVYELTLNDNIFDSPEVNDLDVFSDLTLSIADPETPVTSLEEIPIVGVNPDVGVDDRVFEIHSGQLVSFNGIFIINGRAENSFSNPGIGGGIYVSDQVGEFRLTDSVVAFNQASYGAGIYSQALVTLIESTDISYNIINNTGLFFSFVGGAGIYHGGSELTLNKVSIHNNLIDLVGPSVSALYISGNNSQVSILNTLIADNGVWLLGEGGVVNGIRSKQADLRLNNSNVTGNTGFGVRFLSDDAHIFSLHNSVLAANSFDNCDILEGVIDFGDSLNPAHIVSSDNSCSLPDLPDNFENVDPNLSLLKGRFETLNFHFFSFQFPLPGSPLVDAGSTSNVVTGNLSACEVTDIRDVARPLNGGLGEVCDIGIYESDLIFINGFELTD